MRKKLAVGNWKMNKTPKEAVALAEMLKPKLAVDNAVVAFCVPYVDLVPVAEVLKGSNVLLGAENLHFEDKGAYTGEVSAPMLKEIGVNCVVIGHSERREYFNETDETVNKKVKKALEYDITPIMCCGESLAEREDGITIEKIRIQIKRGLKGFTSDQAQKVVIAYEPIWAIGTGKVATTEQAQEVCHAIRLVLAELFGDAAAQEISILYGGSVSAGNAADLFKMADIDGGLVGGASLKEDFEVIAKAF